LLQKHGGSSDEMRAFCAVFSTENGGFSVFYCDMARLGRRQWCMRDARRRAAWPCRARNASGLMAGTGEAEKSLPLRVTMQFA
jgi:hypothetical protein